MTVPAQTLPHNRKMTRRKVIQGAILGIGAAAVATGVYERARIGQLFQTVEGLFAKASFAHSPLVQEFLHPLSESCAAENTPIRLTSDTYLYEVDEAGDSVGKGFFWRKNGQEGSAPVSLFYGEALNTFLHQDYYRLLGDSGCTVQNVAVKSTVLSDLPRQFLQLAFARPTTLIISDGGNLLLQWCIENEAFLQNLLKTFQALANAPEQQVQDAQKALEKLKAGIESVCLMLQGHYEIALGDLLSLKLNGAQLNTVVILGLPPVWKAATIPLSAHFPPQKVFPMRGNQAAEIFGRYLVINGDNAIKAAINNAYAFLKSYGIVLRYQDITGIVETMDGIHPVPTEQRKIAQELLQHTSLGQIPLGMLTMPPLQDS